MSPTESFWKASVYTVLVLLGLFVSINEKCASVLPIYQLSSGCQPAVCSSNQRPDQCSDDRHDLTSSGLTDIVAPQQSELTPCSSVRSFFRDTRYFWLGCTQFPPCNYKVSRGLRLLYAMELGYYLQASSLRSAP